MSFKLFLNCKDNETTWNKKNYLLKAAERIGIKHVVDIRRRDGEEPTDYILNIEPFDFLIGNKWTGVWEIDLLLDRAATGPDWNYADAIFIADYALPRRLENWRHKTHLLFQACDPTFYWEHIPKTHDFVYGGSLHGGVYNERQRVFDLLKPLFTFVEASGGQQIEAYLQNISRARVQFVRSMDSGVGRGELAQRFFECLAIGPVLTNWTQDLLHTGLIEGEDYLAYRSDEQMLTHMRFLLDNPDKAAVIAANGRKKALLYHTYEHRLMSLLNIIQYG